MHGSYVILIKLSQNFLNNLIVYLLQVYTTRKQLGRRSNEGLLDNSENVSPIGDALPQLSGLQKEIADQLYRTGKLRNNLEKLRLLVELTKKREKYKLEMVDSSLKSI